MAIAQVNPADYDVQTLARAQVSLWRDGLRRLLRNRLALLAGVFLALMITVAFIAWFWTPYDPNAQSFVPFDKPTMAHIFGIDDVGRDALSRLMKGVQISLLVGVLSAVMVLILGVTLGLLAGYFRGWVDTVISFIINAFYGVPPFLVALILYVALGPGKGFLNVVIAISLTVWMDMARLVRGQTLALREREFIEAARAGGANITRILFRHIFPNSLGPIIVQATFVIPGAIIFEAFLSLLGLGIPPPTPSWGSMLKEGVDAIAATGYMTLFPAAALSLTLLAFNFFGDGLRDAFDPRQKR
jgi:oligopeptide transport system permease protein